MELIYGTKNKAKLQSMRKCLQELKLEYGSEIIGLNQLNYDFPEIAENGNNPLDNARLKAFAYYDIIKRPVFSCDSGLYFDGIPEGLQPGLNVRTVNNKRLSDDEMIEYYSAMASNNGGSLVARYINGICLVMGEGLSYEHMGEDIATEKFLLVSAPHNRRKDGFPLDSLSVHIKSNKYYYDLHKNDYDNSEEAWNIDSGFRRFFETALRVKR